MSYALRRRFLANRISLANENLAKLLLRECITNSRLELSLDENCLALREGD